MPIYIFWGANGGLRNDSESKKDSMSLVRIRSLRSNYKQGLFYTTNSFLNF